MLDRNTHYLNTLRRQELERLAQGKPSSFNSFTEYSQRFPEGQFLEAHARQNSILVATYESCIPGNYLMVDIIPWSRTFAVSLWDGDDYYQQKTFPSEEEALAEFENLKLMAPFYLWELTDFGYAY